MFNLAFVGQLRTRELLDLIRFIPPGSRILDFGAGSGRQAQLLAEHGFDVVAIDLADSSYSTHRVFQVVDYDGKHIPLEDHSIDVVFSSNVLEHVEDLPVLLKEFARVIRPGGFGLHVMPTPAWRFWTFVAGLPTAVIALGQSLRDLIRWPPGVDRLRAFRQNSKNLLVALLPLGHGTSPEGFSELWTFSSRSWRKRFEKNGHAVIHEEPGRLFYTGHMTLGDRLGFDARERLSRVLGSGTRIYVVRPPDERAGRTSGSRSSGKTPK